VDEPSPLERRVRKQYNRIAEAYDRRWRGYVLSTLHCVEKWMRVQGSERILDVACGTGALEKLLVARYPAQKIVGVDISENMLSVAREKLQAYPQVIFQQASASKLPFEDASFDLVVCASSFHCFDDPQASLSEFYRVLKSPGRIILLDWCRDYLLCRLYHVFFKALDPAYRRCYLQKELRELLESSNFRVTSEQKFRVKIVWGMMIFEAIKK